jgi:hypothetical protein
LLAAFNQRASNEKEANCHFDFSRIVVNPDYSKYPECLLEHFFLEHYGTPSSFDFTCTGVCPWLFGSKNEGLKIRGR